MVNFNEDSYTVAESASQVSLSLRINGQYFFPVWAIVIIIDGTATGRLCKTCTGDKYCASCVDNLCAFCTSISLKCACKLIYSLL